MDFETRLGELTDGLKQLIKEWEHESKTTASDDWEKGYNKSCASRAIEVKELLEKIESID